MDFNCPDDEDMPATRDADENEDDAEDGNITNDVGDTSADVRQAVAKELARGRGAGHIQQPHSPVKAGAEPRTMKRKARATTNKSPQRKKGNTGASEESERVTKTPHNSELFPANIRPEMFRSDVVFNALSFDKASTFVHEYGMLQEKIKLKDRNRNSQEKCDDTMKPVEVPDGTDDAMNNLNIVARQLRPVNKEIGEQMAWQVRQRKEVVRNLPLETYGLADRVPTKPIELCHNLASNLTIDMFCPSGKKSTTTKQTACKTKDGELAVETAEVYGDLDSVQDVLMAWSTLMAIWQKIFPEWPAAQIGLMVIFKMKMFAHCGASAKDVMILFSNRFLTSNSQRAASKKGPLSYERAENLARNICGDEGFAKDPVAVRGRGVQPMLGGDPAPRGRGAGQGRGRGAGGRGDGGQAGGPFASAVKIGNDTVCPFYQVRILLSSNMSARSPRPAGESAERTIPRKSMIRQNMVTEEILMGLTSVSIYLV